jgi:hypothetical protein
MKALFRFQNLGIWKKAVEIGNKLFDIAERLARKKLYRFALLAISPLLLIAPSSTLHAPCSMPLTRGLITDDEETISSRSSKWSEK